MPLIIPGNSQASTGFTIDQSIRFNDDDSGRMGRTPSSASNRRTWTLSVWIKRGNLDSSGFKFIFSRTEASVAANIAFYQDSLYFSAASAGHELNLTTNRKFRDPSAWYHIIIAQDTTQAVSSERVRIYVNGQRETSFSTETYPALNYQGYINTAALHDIGVSRPSGSLSGYFDGYMAEIHLLDGYAYDPSFFGEFNNSGIWIPKEYTGSYGTNGFKIDGRDSSDLGDDESGNGNDYATSGLSADDQQPDSPTNNHAVFNPIEAETLITYSEGNLAIAYSGNSARNLARSTIEIPASTDAFFEMVMTSNLGSGVDFAIGIEDGTAQSDNSNSIYNNAFVIREDGNFIDQNSSGSYGVSFTNTDVIGVWRKANGDLVFYKNGTAMNSGTPAKTGLTGTMFFVAGPFNGASAEARFASSKWTNKPSGVTNSMALNTSNLGS